MLWERLIESLEKTLSEADDGGAKEVLGQAFAHIERNTKKGLQKQMERLTGQSLWLGVFPTGLLESFIAEHTKLIKGLQRDHLEKIGLAIQRGRRQGRLQKDSKRYPSNDRCEQTPGAAHSAQRAAAV